MRTVSAFVPADFQDDRKKIAIKSKEECRANRCVRDYFTETQLAAQAFCTSWCCELLIAMCVAVDISVGVADLCGASAGDSDRSNLLATCCILAVFLYERTLRAYGFWRELRFHPFWVVDCLIVDASAVVAALVVANALTMDSKSTITLMRVMRMLRVFVALRNLNITARIRRAVSSQKTRFREDGFDLDLTYVTETCIAMSVPGIGAEVGFRNPASEVQRFFATRHRDRFLIFNLCREREYDPAIFDGRVVRYDVEDHNPPRLSQIMRLLEAAGRFMDMDPLNCIAIHCRGGKGRTGVMVCAWLLYTRFCRTTGQALEWFAAVRTGERARAAQGVSQPSQRRYVGYAERAIAAGGYHVPSVVLRRIVVRAPPRRDSRGELWLWFTVEENGRTVFDLRVDKVDCLAAPSANPDGAELSFDVGVTLQGDVRIVFYDHDDATAAPPPCGCELLRRRQYVAADDLCFFMWFHTGFVEEGPYVLRKADVDIACHDKACKVFPNDFEVELDLGGPPQALLPPTPQTTPTQREGPTWLLTPTASSEAGVAGAHVARRRPFRRLAPASGGLLERTRAMRMLYPLLQTGSSRRSLSAQLSESVLPVQS
jgi:PTEN homologous phosphatase